MCSFGNITFRRLISKFSITRYKTCRRYCSSKLNVSQEENNDDFFPLERIRNFSIIAHIDHGKSTLADRLLEHTGAIKPNADNAQVLDQLQVERERGITVKAVSASLNYNYNDEQYLLNLIDTPGHVDFSNEVTRSVQACQGAILVVDAAEGPQAQTVAVYNLACKRGLKVIPVLNKIDLKNANPKRAKEQLESLFQIEPSEVLEVSAKKGWGIEELIEALIKRIPSPPVSRDSYFKALIFDSWYDKYRGVMCLAYIENGVASIGSSVRWLSSPKIQSLKHICLLTPGEKPVKQIAAGQVALISCGPKGGGAVGDILLSASAPITDIQNIEKTELKHMVFAGIFPLDQSEFQCVKSAIEKLTLNDSAVDAKVDNSPALGQGWRIGFLGLLHMEVFTQRLLQEHEAKAIITTPSVPYKVKIKGPKLIKQYGGDLITITNPNDMPDSHNVVESYEPFVIGTVHIPTEYMGSVIGLCVSRRGIHLSTTPIDENNTILQYRLPLSEIIVDFHDSIKSLTSGYGTFDYNDDGFHPSVMTKIEIRLNGETINELSMIVHRSCVQYAANRLTEKLKLTIPRQMIHIAIQAYAEGRIVSRENLQAFRKDVTAKLYGGDVTRRMKLLKQQAEGKKKMKSLAVMKVPRETLINVLRKE